MHHQLKCWPEPFEAIATKRKLFELRLNDRGFLEGDSVLLKEWEPKTCTYSGRWIFCRVGYVLYGPCEFGGLEAGYCIWTIVLPNNHSYPEKVQPDPTHEPA